MLTQYLLTFNERCAIMDKDQTDMNNINAIIYVSPIIDKQGDEYIIDYCEMVKSKLVVKEARFSTLLEADIAREHLKNQLKNI